jgi:hypothetical protein
MRGWNNEEPEQYAMPSHTVPMRGGRGRGGPRGAMRGMRGGRGGGMPPNRPVRMQRPPQVRILIHWRQIFLLNSCV